MFQSCFGREEFAAGAGLQALKRLHAGLMWPVMPQWLHTESFHRQSLGECPFLCAYHMDFVREELHQV